ncbi:MAG: HpcH/HpaI aldolase family protein [Thermodesulfobacteriota bacterium]
MAEISLKQNLANSRITIGSWITLGHPAIAEIMARAGFDWLVVDLEHSVITIREAEELIRVIDLCGVTPLVRLSANDPVQIKRVMDAGAHGIIVPMVNSALEAEQAVAAVKYPPQGRRGVGLARAQGYGTRFEEYKSWLERESVVIVQVEHIKAVENLETILAVAGVDGFIVGPYDLSGSLGLPGQFDHPLMTQAMMQIQVSGARPGKVRGIHVVEPDVAQLQHRLEEGYQFIAFSVDIRMLDHSCRACLSSLGR